MNDNNNTDTKDNTMQLDSTMAGVLTTIKEAFTAAVKAEVEKNGGTQETDMDDVKRMIEGNFDEWFTNCLSDVDIANHVGVDGLVSEAVNEAVSEIDLGDAVNDQLSYHDIPNESRVEEMIVESSSTGMSLYDANEMLRQVARGGDCEDGNAFREAVIAVVNADKLKNGVSVDDGTHMSVKANGTDREIQAILERRRSYFEALHSALNALMGSAPNGSMPPAPDNGGDRSDAWHQEQVEKMVVPDLTVVNQRLWNVASQATHLLGLLSGLYHGENGNRSVRIAGQWEAVLHAYKAKVEA